MKDIQQLHISRQLTTLIDSGLPLLDAIKLMGFESVEKYLNQGQSLSFALEKLGFHSFCIGLIKTGIFNSLIKSFFSSNETSS
jgi:type II secretory pathway component PulF